VSRPLRLPQTFLRGIYASSSRMPLFSSISYVHGPIPSPIPPSWSANARCAPPCMCQCQQFEFGDPMFLRFGRFHRCALTGGHGTGSHGARAHSHSAHCRLGGDYALLLSGSLELVVVPMSCVPVADWWTPQLWFVTVVNVISCAIRIGEAGFKIVDEVRRRLQIRRPSSWICSLQACWLVVRWLVLTLEMAVIAFFTLLGTVLRTPKSLVVAISIASSVALAITIVEVRRTLCCAPSELTTRRAQGYFDFSAEEQSSLTNITRSVRDDEPPSAEIDNYGDMLFYMCTAFVFSVLYLVALLLPHFPICGIRLPKGAGVPSTVAHA
jgi:hypothetical protein